LPERAHHGLDVLSELRALFAAVPEVATHETKAATEKDMKTTLGHMHDMTKNAEHEMHATLLSCKRARKQMLAVFRAQKSSLEVPLSLAAPRVAKRQGWARSSRIEPVARDHP
jgi:hypothetical protein